MRHYLCGCVLIACTIAIAKLYERQESTKKAGLIFLTLLQNKCNSVVSQYNINGSSEFGKQPTIANVYNGIVMIRRGDGALVASSFYTFFISLHQHILNKKWKEALSLCRVAQVINIHLVFSSINSF